jgi:formylglycine-generating enzyme required for sulfatase activity
MKKIRILLVAVVAVLMMAACGPSPEELVRQGKEHYDNDNYTEAMACFQKAAEKGNAEAEYHIGELYDYGFGVDEDDEIAADWYKKSAEKGYAEAQDRLASMYFVGNGVGKDYEKAAKWAQKALEQGDYCQSMVVLGTLYSIGEAVPQDHKKAVYYLEKAIDVWPDAIMPLNVTLTMLYLEGDGTQDDEKAIEMVSYSNKVGRCEAMNAIGMAYYTGEDVNQNYAKAFKWIEKSANCGYAEGQCNLGWLYYNGEGVTKSIQDAKYWWQKAADQGLEEAKESLRYLANAEFHNKTFTVNGISFDMIAVKGGTFTMGCTSEQSEDCSSDEEPAHKVTLSDFYIGKFVVTQKLWKAVMRNNPSYFKGDYLPVESVSWYDCQEFITKLNNLTGLKFRLPTEAEWEYAARGGNKSKGYKYSGSNTLRNVAWYSDNNDGKTHPVGQKLPNELGIYDMSGNVDEWCQDWWGKYSSGSQTNPKGPSSGEQRVLRGGFWSAWARYCRVSFRNLPSPPEYGTFGHGFRLALSE